MWEAIASVIGVVALLVTPLIATWATGYLRKKAAEEKRRKQKEKDRLAQEAKVESERLRNRLIADRAQTASEAAEDLARRLRDPDYNPPGV